MLGWFLIEVEVYNPKIRELLLFLLPEYHVPNLQGVNSSTITFRI